MSENNKVLFDLKATQPTLKAKFHGGSEYAKYVFFKIIECGYSNLECIYNPEIELDKTIKASCEKNQILLNPARTVDDLSIILKSGKYRTFYSALPYGYSKLETGNSTFKMTIHGLRYIECPEDEYDFLYEKYVLKSRIKKYLKRLLKPNSRKKSTIKQFDSLLSIPKTEIVAVSNHTKYSILNFFPYLHDKNIRVFYSPMPKLDEHTNFSQLEEKYGLEKDYYLLISANRWIKNSYRAIVAFDRLFSQGLLHDKRVVIVGARDIISNFKIKNLSSFLFLDYLSWKDLSLLYRNAFCFVYPTLNEGFGYPPLYAMKCEVPVLASANTSIPEVCGNAALYFNPKSIDEIQTRVLYMNNDTKLRKNLIKNGIYQYSEVQNKQVGDIKDLINFIMKN